MTINYDDMLLEDGLALGTVELSAMKSMLDNGDRGGFYATYYAATHELDDSAAGTSESALQTKISTFSDDVGAIAFFSNALLQQALETNGYPGIYYLSQKVANSAWNVMAHDAVSASAGPAHIKDGVVNLKTFYNSAENAWAGENVLKAFPGNLLTEMGQNNFSNLISTIMVFFTSILPTVITGGQISSQTINGFILEGNGEDAGARAAALSSLYVGFTIGAGKHVSAYEGDRYKLVESTDGRLSYVTDIVAGKVVAVEDSFTGGSQGLSETGFEYLTALMNATFSIPVVAALKQALSSVFDPLAPVDGDWTKLTESTVAGVYDGDRNTPGQENVYTPSDHSVLRDIATADHDVLFGSDSLLGLGGDDVIDGLAGNDIIFGSGGDDTLSGGLGDDIVHGQSGDDTLYGGDGDDVVRGGEGNDLIHGGRLPTELDPLSPDGSPVVTVDLASDTIIAGAGDDVVYVAGGSDKVVLNSGDDKIFLAPLIEEQNSEGKWELPVPAHTVIWGGEGADSYHFLENARQWNSIILYADEISTQFVENLDSEKLFTDLESEFNTSFDYVILNPDESDRFYDYKGNEVSYTVDTFQYDAFYEGVFSYELGEVNGVEFIDGIPVAKPTTWKTQQYGQTSYSYVGADGEVVSGPGTFERPNDPNLKFSAPEMLYNTISLNQSNPYLTGEIQGITNGVGGVVFGENRPYSTTTNTSTLYSIAEFISTSFALSNQLGVYKAVIDGHPSLGEALSSFSNTENSPGSIRSDYFYEAGKFTVDLKSYQLDFEAPEVGPVGPSTPPSDPTGITSGDDIYIGLATGDIANLIGGNDIGFGGDGSDIISGGDGNDLIFGQNDDDLLQGDAGHNYLDGGGGNDTAVYSGDLNQYVVTMDPNGAVIVNGVGVVDTVKNVENYKFGNTTYTINQIVTNASNVIVGTSSDDNIVGTAGNDVILGGAGDDVMYGGAGNDFLDGQAGTNNQVNFDGYASDYVFTKNADGTTTALNTVSGTDTLTNVYGVWFLAESAWYELSTLHTNKDSNVIYGSAVDDVIIGTQAGDTIYGGDGNDVLYGGRGDDTLLGEGGGYNQADYDGAAEDYSFTLNSNGTTTVTSNQYGTDILSGISGIWFKGSQTWSSISDLQVNGWVGNDDVVQATAGVAVDLNLDDNDIIPTGSDVVQYIWVEPEHGTVSWDSAKQTFMYVADAGYVGVDTLRYGLHDGNNSNAIMTPDGVDVTINVTAGDPSVGETVDVGNGNGYYGGTSRNDIVNFLGGTGNYVNGGAGEDIIVFSGAAVEYEILGQGDHFTVTHSASGSSIQFTEIENLGFSGEIISLEDIIAQAGHAPGDTWFEPEPIGGLV